MCESGIADTHELIDISSDEENDIELISEVKPTSSNGSDYSRLAPKRSHAVDSDHYPIIICGKADVNDIVTRYAKTLRSRLKRKNVSFFTSKELADEFVHQCFLVNSCDSKILISQSFSNLITNALLSIGSDSAKDANEIISNHLIFIDNLKKMREMNSNEESRVTSERNNSVKKDEEVNEGCGNAEDDDIFYDAYSELKFEVCDRTNCETTTNSQSTNESHLIDIVNGIEDNSNDNDTKGIYIIEESETNNISDSEKLRKIKKYRKMYDQLKKKIEGYEHMEINLNDLSNMDLIYENDSLIQQLIRVWERMCELEGRQPISEREVNEAFQFDFIDNRDIRERLETEMNALMLVNGFPDLPAIVESVSSVIVANNLSSRPEFSDEEKVLIFCKQIFRKIGDHIQCRRQKDRHEFINKFLSGGDFDAIELPESTDEVLREKLENNRKLSAKNMAQVFEKFESLDKRITKRKKKSFAECARKQKLFEQSGAHTNNIDNENTVNNNNKSDVNISAKIKKRITPIQVLNVTNHCEVITPNT